jgi:signal transduction histidine kinase
VISKDELSEEIANMQKVLELTIQSVRRIVTDLRPEILDLGLQAAIDWHAQQFTVRTKIPVEIKSNIEGVQIKNSEKSAALFRIFQETLTNVARHSKASRVEVEFDQDRNEVILKVKDNGRGITESDLAKSNSFGILGLKERAYLLGGEVDIEGRPGIGTTVSVRIPKSSLNI